MTGDPNRVRGRDRGMTLIELVVAMAVFALVAVMGLQALSGTLRQRDRAQAQATEAAVLAQGLALLRHDMTSIVPLLFFPPGSPRPVSALRGGADGVAFSVAGQPGLPGSEFEPGMHRLSWVLDPGTGRLTRRSWPTLWPARADQQGPEVVVFREIEALRLRSYWVGYGWLKGTRPPEGISAGVSGAGGEDGDQTNAAPEVYSDLLPQALEVTVIHRRHGAITLIEALQ